MNMPGYEDLTRDEATEVASILASGLIGVALGLGLRAWAFHRVARAVSTDLGFPELSFRTCFAAVTAYHMLLHSNGDGPTAKRLAEFTKERAAARTRSDTQAAYRPRTAPTATR